MRIFSKTKTVLLVDNDLDLLEATEDMLQDEGYKIMTAKNGKEGVACYKKNKPGIVFLDLRMPLMDGYETFFEIKKFDKKAKIVFVTAHGIHNEKYDAAVNQGLLDMIKKPAELEDLKFLIDKYA